jgi:hypothetical protein
MGRSLIHCHISVSSRAELMERGMKKWHTARDKKMPERPTNQIYSYKTTLPLREARIPNNSSHICKAYLHQCFAVNTSPGKYCEQSQS